MVAHWCPNWFQPHSFTPSAFQRDLINTSDEEQEWNERNPQRHIMSTQHRCSFIHTSWVMCKNKRLRAACWFGTDKPDERFISFSILFLFFLTSALRRGKFSPSTFVPSGHQEKHFCFTFFKYMHFPISSQACVDRADCAEAAHITSPLLLTARFHYPPPCG